MTAAFKDACKSAPQPLTTVVRHNCRFLANKKREWSPGATALPGDCRRNACREAASHDSVSATAGTTGSRSKRHGKGREETVVHAGVQSAGYA